MTPPKHFLSWVLMLAIWSCTSKKTETISEAKADVASTSDTKGSDEAFDRWYKIESYVVKDVPNDSIQVIDSVGVIVISPSEEQIDRMIKEYGEDDFYTVADDNSFYLASAITQLDSFAVKTIMAEKRYLKLTGEKDSWLIDVRQEGAPEWNLIFFDKAQPPKVMSAIDVTPEELLNYFGADH